MRPLLAGFIALTVACSGGTGPDTPPPPPPPVVVTDLTPLSTIPVPPQYGVHDTFIRDGILFLCAWNTGLILMDAGNGIRGGTPAHPVEISRIVTDDDAVPGGPAVHSAWWFHNPVTGERRYVFVGQEGPGTIGVSSLGDIHVIDVSDLAQPREVAFYHMNTAPPAGSHNLWMDEAAQVLFASYYNGGVVALNVAGTLSGDIASREITRFKPSPGAYIWGIQGSAGSIYVTDMLEGLYQLRFSGAATPLAAGGGNVPERYTSDLFVSGSWAYTGTWGAAARNGVLGNVLKIWRLGAGAAPTLADSLVLDGIATVADVKGSADGKLLVIGAEKGTGAGLYVYSLANPARPVLVGRALIAAGIHTARIADIGGRRYIFAAKNPGQPVDPALLIYDVTALSP